MNIISTDYHFFLPYWTLVPVIPSILKGYPKINILLLLLYLTSTIESGLHFYLKNWGHYLYRVYKTALLSTALTLFFNKSVICGNSLSAYTLTGFAVKAAMI